MRKAVLVLAAVLCACPLRVTQKRPPTAERILDRYVEVTGGKAAYAKIRTEVNTGAIEYVGKGVKGPVAAYLAGDDSSYLVLEIPGAGKIEQGTTHGVAWERSALMGPRLKSGEEKAQALREAGVTPRADWKKHFVKAELAGEETVEGQACWRVVLTPREGKPETRFYDKETGRLVRVDQTVTSPMGEIQAQTYVEDYRAVS